MLIESTDAHVSSMSTCPFDEHLSIRCASFSPATGGACGRAPCARTPSGVTRSSHNLVCLCSQSAALQRKPNAVKFAFREVLRPDPEVDAPYVTPHHACIVIRVHLKEQTPLSC